MEKDPFCVNAKDRSIVSEVSSLNKDCSTDCPECNLKFESPKSLDVHLEYHRERLLSKWASEADVSAPPPSCTPESPALLTSVVLSSSGRDPATTTTTNTSSMQISMAQSMGIQQRGVPPHLSAHHSANPTENSNPGLPSITTDVSDFFTQLESGADTGSTVLTINSLTAAGSDLKINRFHPYESRSQVFSGGQNTVMMSQSTGGSYFGETGNLYQNTSEYLAGFPPELHDHSGEDIWDLDANTVRRYNPVSPVNNTSAAGYAQHQQQHHPPPQQHTPVQSSKPAWESSASSPIYPQYGAVRGQTSMPPQPISPGIGGPWIGGSLPVKGQSVVESKRPKSYQCEACDKWFTSSGHLKRHFNTTLHKNAMKQKGDGYLDGINGGTFSIPSVESRGAPSPCMSLGEESSQSSICDELSSQSGQVCLTPVSTPGPVTSIISVNPPTSSPNSNTSSNVPNVSPSQQMLSPPPESASSPLSGLTQLVGVAAPPSTPQSNSPLTPASGISLSPNGNLNGSPAHKNRFSPFRGGPANTISYKVQSLEQRSYPSYPATFQTLSAPAAGTAHNYNGDVYMSSQTAFRNDGYNTAYTGQYQTQYQPVVYNANYDMGGNYLNHPSYTDISGYVPIPGEAINLFPENVRTLKLDERDSPEGSEGSEASIKTDNGEFRCNECNKIFNKMCYLKQHNKSFHNGEKPFKCTQCGKRFPVEVLYQEHLAKHAGDKPYKCDVCPKQFNHKTDLRRHMCLHTGEKPFTCDVCGKGFIREDRMVKHADTHKKKAAHVTGGMM